MATLPDAEAAGGIDQWTKPAFLRRVRIRGYKSIAFCDVALEPLTILVGRNGAGKSNFLDALAFLRDVMALGVTEAVNRRGGWPVIASRVAATQRIELEIVAGFTGSHPHPRSGHNGPDEAAAPELRGQVFSARYHLGLSVNPFS